MQLTPKVLRTTNSLLLCSIIFFFIYSKKNIFEKWLCLSLCLAFIFAQIFWKNPIRYSLIHRIDSYIAKTAIISFIGYTLMYKELLHNKRLYSYLFIVFGIFFSFYKSNYHSSKSWCCSKHICWHAWLHILCFIGSFYAFL